MSVNNINDSIPFYKQALASGELQKIYQSLVVVIQAIRTDFNKEYKGKFAVANLLHGYIDYTYFYLQNDFLKNRKLKLAIVLNHKEARFELWLLGQTKSVQANYWNKLRDVKWINQDSMPHWSIFDVVMVANPDFDDKETLSNAMLSTFSTLSEEIFTILKTFE
ncbi:DUF7000 family protein [Colwellia sp. RSH04]|uniref:DUF7000 family protein n=1 Tax=Colwellia sp. RSH04 TaxID=2305464 RepID=UPI000E58EC5E|nr:hypothetical protein [Colwellia sp. RSH04]RHW76066.1 hypothetical protein D1094_10395 [Colwellia sp. RSH04]